MIRSLARSRWRLLIAVGALLAGLRLVPAWWSGRDAAAWFEGPVERQTRLARGVGRWVERQLSRNDFHTGSRKFDGEWLFGTHMMAGMGLGQTALQHPESRAELLRLMGRCIDRLLSPELRRFDREDWGNDPLETLSVDAGADHAAYLGYLNLVLGLERLLDRDSRHAALNDQISAALARRLRRSPLLLLQSYPREVYPVDNSAVIGSIGLHGRATGTDTTELVGRWSARLRQRYLDPATGLLIQRVHPDRGSAVDAPRGSGSTLGAYFLSFADRQLSAQLYRAVREQLHDTVLGFGVIREYPVGQDGPGDIDSGPVVFGFGVSATGFALGPARIHGDAVTHARLFATATLFGAPLERDGTLEYVTGGPLGNAILFAMLTAAPAEERSR